MPIDYDSTGVSLEGPGGFLMPDGEYDFSIIGVEEKTSSKGNYMVSVKASVINNADFNGQWVFHNVTFLDPDAKGAGMAIHFLKAIGMKWEGKIRVVPDNWLGCAFKGVVNTTEYKGKKRNEIASIEPMGIKPLEPIDDDKLPF